ncbi:MAG: hypothetical protein KAU46_12245 [Candidatus Aminicenantes bacterium]|nr:hypothetical protein [Candidatus Aminicenantes bacterium]
MKEEQGFILVLAVIIMTFMFLLVVPFLLKVSTEQELTKKSFDSLAALSLAEAGVERAIWEINHGDISSWSGSSSLRTKNISSFQASGGDIIGDIQISVEDSLGDNPVVEATGSVSYFGSLTVTRTVRVGLEREFYQPWDHGTFGGSSIIMDSNVVMDSYDSTLGEYGVDGNVGSEGNLGTNATGYDSISLNGSTQINGSAYCGPEGDPSTAIQTHGSSSITGGQQASSKQKRMPSVPPPEGLPSGGDYFLGGSDTDTISQSGEYSNFYLDSNATVTITGDVTFYIIGDFFMGSNSTFVIESGSSVTIYLDGSFFMDSNTNLNNSSKDPTKLLIFGTDNFIGTQTINSNAEFYGAIYAPNADITIDSNCHFYGSVSANRIEYNSNVQIHYDKALTQFEIVQAAVEELPCIVLSWQEKF